MELNLDTAYHGFTFDTHEDLPEIDGDAYVGRHGGSGARILYLRNDDNNKAFAIGFRTPPKDDTGVFHILEHSVLCGSRRFPVKEPFVDLLKSSMQTFLNAMTFADKTLYPVASTNEQDLFNLMDVYLDAVFHPQIYQKRAIFEQEGWHCELKANDPSAEDAAALGPDETTLVYNGVVYNEMKGALSDASSVLYDELQKALFPDTCYAFESGGTPQAIPTLTYEEYLDEHRRHYRTDNSYIILYGNLDIDRALAFLDERYLAPVAREQRERDDERASASLAPLRPRAIELQPPVKPAFLRRTMDTAPENACAACGYVIGDSSERLRGMAVEILLDALFGSNEAPLKRSLLDAGIAHDVIASVSDALLQPFAFIELRIPAEGAGQALPGTLAEHVRALVAGGLDKQLVEAAISHAEFIMREHDSGYADGVMHAMVSLSSWLYDDEAPLDYVRYERAFAELRDKLDGDYYETLLIDLFCESEHCAGVEIVPAPGTGDDGTAAKLAEMNEGLSPDQRKQIVAEEAALRELQEAPDTPEAIATLPRLSVADIGEAPEEPRYDLDWKTPITCVRHSVATRGIAYAYRYFDLKRLSFEDIPYLAVLARVLGKLDTAHHTAAELDTLIQAKLGNLTFYTEVLNHRSNTDIVIPRFVVSASALSENAEALASIPREVLLETDFSNTAKILDILKQRKIGMEQAFVNAGHTCAAGRVKSYYSKVGVLNEQLGNVDFYRFLCDLVEHFDERAEGLVARLQAVSEQVFCDNGCTVSFAGSDRDYDAFWLSKPGCDRQGADVERLSIPEPVVRNEAFIVPSDVCFAALGWDRRLLEQPYSGSWTVASRALSFDYLWNEVRVKGGAYGVGFQALRQGNMRFYSYRDPHLDETLERFEAAADWLARFDPSPEGLEGFIVASVAGVDAPVKPRELVKRQAAEFFTLRKPEERREIRDQMIRTDVNAVRALAPVLEEAVGKHAVCAFGNRGILEASNAELALVPLVGAGDAVQAI